MSQFQFGEFPLFLTDEYYSRGDFATSDAPALRKSSVVAPLVHPTGSREPIAHTLALNVRGLTSGIILPPGLTVITGATAVGKSTLVRQLAAASPTNREVIHINATEPFDDPSSELAWFASVDAALVYAIERQIADPSVLPVIDSLRAMLFEMSGAATSKGMVARFFTQITRVSNALAANGLTVLATVNPMESSPEFVSEFINRLSAALPATIVVTGRTGGGRRRVAEGYIVMRGFNEREATPFTYEPSSSPKAPTPLETYTLIAPHSGASLNPLASVASINAISNSLT